MQPSELSFAQKRDWLRLTRTSTVGPVAFRDLIMRYGDAGTALNALPDLARRSTKLRIPPIEEIEAEMQACDDMGVNLIASCEPDYPHYLRAVDPPPPLISVVGDIKLAHRPCTAIIGSRNASAIGLRFARQIATELGEAGHTIISGLARGIDASAHAGALETGTIGVLGGGVDHIYPRQNTDLYHAMAKQGALISESPLGYRATARDFPRRNRIISGLCQGVVVIEAAERSGTLITARYALEQNREVMAAPGSPLDPRTKGCNRLIRQGAALIENTQDILDVLNNTRAPYVEEDKDGYHSPSLDWDDIQNNVDKARDILLSLCSPTPTQRDEIIRQSAISYPIAAAALLELELSGEITVEGDGRLAITY
ncbi:MAG TPA: DNA-protecting protein DprA [Hellea balneolensis]|uniref:DNA-protecting protein DprA n=1 Tax=Hellea balneolensis TaxID=287478 RepID=A0A7C3G0E7_9PROT|nr:DNA-protecting protein DprA [Hellea balneolensis]